MHTLKIIAGGFLLLGACLLVGRWTGAMATAVKCFLALWLIATLANMWFGVHGAGYSIKDEAPVALLVYAVPAIAAVVIWRRFFTS